MSNLQIAALYAAANLAVLLVLALGVVRQRWKHRVQLGDGGVEALQRAIRAHANAAEYVPPALAGLALLALAPTPAWALHAVGGGLTVARVLHGVGLSGSSGRSVGRALGTLLTWIAFLGLIALLLQFALAG